MITKERINHRASLVKSYIGPVTIIAILSLISDLINILVQHSGHPMELVTACLNLVLIGIGHIFVRFGKPEFVLHLAVPYFLVHAVITVCCYQEWEPKYFVKYPKDPMENKIIHNFILINVIPLIDVFTTTFLMFPILIVSTCLKLWKETELRRKEYSFLPPEIQA
jgi:hypothetical protein